jgi:putative ABC transport system substrate-binding protein
VAAFRDGLQKLGWSDGRNVRIEERWGADSNQLRTYAGELAQMSPEVILAGAAAGLMPLQRATQAIPIVFANVPDPMANGFIASLARPGGNITGFANYEPKIAVKWLELLKQLAPRVARGTFLYDPANPTGDRYLHEIQAAAASFGVEMRGAAVRDAATIEQALDARTLAPNGGLVVAGGPATSSHHALIIALADRNRLPPTFSAVRCK